MYQIWMLLLWDRKTHKMSMVAWYYDQASCLAEKADWLAVVPVSVLQCVGQMQFIPQ